MPGGHDTTNEVRNIMSFVLYTQILKQSVLKPASPGMTLNQLCDAFGETWGHFPDAGAFSPEPPKSAYLGGGGWCRHCIGEMSIIDVYFC